MTEDKLQSALIGEDYRQRTTDSYFLMVVCCQGQTGIFIRFKQYSLVSFSL